MTRRDGVGHALVDASVAVILENQAASGAYAASPAFANYAYCWLRDGTFTAYAMDQVGEHDSARAFHRWVIRAVRSRREEVERQLRTGVVLGEPVALPARFTLDGTLDDSGWPALQLDGYGAWLWGLCEHVQSTRDPAFFEEAADAIRLVLGYLRLAWRSPNYDCWEEHGDRVHTSTIACLAGGIERVAALTGEPSDRALAASIREYLLTHAVVEGRLSKFCDAFGDATGSGVDGSLLWAMVPFRVVEPGDAVAVNTVERIRRDLVRGGGVHRYARDTYYGGGLWLLLSAWLGWYEALAGRIDEARAFLGWVEAQADEDGLMPEQVNTHLLDPGSYEPWVRRWGPIAKPLLWSHAMYLVLWRQLRDA